MKQSPSGFMPIVGIKHRAIGPNQSQKQLISYFQPSGLEKLTKQGNDAVQRFYVFIKLLAQQSFFRSNTAKIRIIVPPRA